MLYTEGIFAIVIFGSVISKTKVDHTLSSSQSAAALMVNNHGLTCTLSVKQALSTSITPEEP